jgi:hypothetical protein
MLISDYALGGATALLFYLPPVETDDYDIFVFVTSKSVFAPISELYEFLRKAGYSEFKDEHIMIDGSAVQVLIPPSPLVEEAVRNAVLLSYDGSHIPVMKLEYLMAILLETNRTKDKLRMDLIFESDIEYDEELVRELILRFGLVERWNKIINNS